MELNSKQAKEILNAIIFELEKRGKYAVVAIVDAHGELLAFERMDKTKLPSIANAINKAYTAARTQKNTSEIGKALKDPVKGFDIAFYGDPKICGWGGGVPVISNGNVIGAASVSGLSQEEDEEIAKIGVAHLKLI
ncbi:GlcG/HbpS family heme-binding protein [Sporocytophaga myxococcoides]|uniref:GlcG/HbpS family heme-binding protein n=1 Tax=Sporocytophaga myxococcoides TaxID=153721 RepID=UPI00040E80E2|nr:heme-binding protein [Sporocytophaga myxococcoides]